MAAIKLDNALIATCDWTFSELSKQASFVEMTASNSVKTLRALWENTTVLRAIQSSEVMHFRFSELVIVG